MFIISRANLAKGMQRTAAAGWGAVADGAGAVSRRRTVPENGPRRSDGESPGRLPQGDPKACGWPHVPSLKAEVTQRHCVGDSTNGLPGDTSKGSFRLGPLCRTRCFSHCCGSLACAGPAVPKAWPSDPDEHPLGTHRLSDAAARAPQSVFDKLCSRFGHRLEFGNKEGGR